VGSYDPRRVCFMGSGAQLGGASRPPRRLRAEVPRARRRERSADSPTTWCTNTAAGGNRRARVRSPGRPRGSYDPRSAAEV